MSYRKLILREDIQNSLAFESLSLFSYF